MAKRKSSTPPGHVNLRMLAERLALSQTTVSLVLNNSPSAKSIPQETRNRVIEAAERLNYRPNYFARSLRQKRSMSVGVLAPDLSEGYFTRVMSGVVQELTAARYFYFTACHDWKRELIEKYPRMLVERAVDGFLLLNGYIFPAFCFFSYGLYHFNGYYLIVASGGLAACARACIVHGVPPIHGRSFIARGSCPHRRRRRTIRPANKPGLPFPLRNQSRCGKPLLPLRSQ